MAVRPGLWSRAWIEEESHWNEYDQMDVWG